MKPQKILALILFSFCTLAFAQNEIKKINIVNSFQRWPQDVQHNVYLNSFVEKISKQITGTRFGVYSGDPITTTNAFEYVGNGRATMMWTQSSYLSSKEYSFALLSQPLFMSSQQFFKWRGTPMAVQSIDKLYEKYGVKALPCAAIDMHMDFLMRRLPDNDYQFKGAKVAIGPPATEVYAATGMHTNNIPVTETYRALEMGTIDGAYTFTPHESIQWRIFEFSKVLYFPSVVRSFAVLDLMVNLKYWNELSSADRFSIEQVCTQSIQDSLSRSRKLALDGADKYKKAGIPVMALPAQDVMAMQAKWLEVVAKQSAFDPMFESIYKSLYGK
jgi:TRAP-type mannitol/chloroaromatic compound transport system substrate-binding protein